MRATPSLIAKSNAVSFILSSPGRTPDLLFVNYITFFGVSCQALFLSHCRKSILEGTKARNHANPTAQTTTGQFDVLVYHYFICRLSTRDADRPKNQWEDGPSRDAAAGTIWRSAAPGDDIRSRGRFQRWALRSHPMAHRTFAWLRRNKPRAPRVTLVHGDYRLGNFLERDGRISAILDWELVHLGDPIEDLGWAFLPQYRGGTRMVCQLADEDAFLARYQDKAGYQVDRDALRFYIVFSLLKLALTHMAAARCFEDGLFNDMRMPAMATQIAPVFRQIAKIMERGS
jgi:hypothetical protein